MNRFIGMLIPLVFVMISMSACQGGGDMDAPSLQGGTDATNPPSAFSRFSGSVPTLEEAGYLGTGCVATQMVAKNQEGEESKVDIKTDDCSFNLLLKANTTYTMYMKSFTNAVIKVMVKSASGGYTPDIFLGDIKLDLGMLIVNVSGQIAYAVTIPTLTPTPQDEETAGGGGGEYTSGATFQLTGEPEEETDDALEMEIRENRFHIIGGCPPDNPHCDSVGPSFEKIK